MALEAARLIADVKLRLSSSKLTSDFPISDLQIMQWLRGARDSIVARHLEVLSKDGNHIPGEYIEVMATGTPALVDEGISVYRLTLANNVEFLSVNGNKQLASALIIDLSANTQVKVRAVDFQELENIRIMEFTAPSTTHPICYLRENYIYFEGIGASVSATVYGVKAYTGTTVDIADMVFSGQHTEDIVAAATKIGMFELNPNLYDTINDGKEFTIKHIRG